MWFEMIIPQKKKISKNHSHALGDPSIAMLLLLIAIYTLGIRRGKKY
jgi:membrane-bound ClpP family serine protease